MTTPHSEVQHAHSPYEKDAIRENDERSTSDLHEPFHNLDDPTVLAESTEALVAPLSRNFVVEFGDSHAHVTFDLNPAEFEEYLDSDRPSALSTRWINIWSPFQQTSVLEMLGQRYDFSPRLLALMCAEPRRRLSSTHLSLRTAAAAQGCGLSGAASKQSSSTRSRPNANLVSVGLSNNSRIGNLYDIVDEVWQYSSIDQGRSYLCLGTNSLYPIGHLLPAGGSGDSRNDTEQMNIPIPDVKRVWSWLLLLSDRTVVTITEDLFPYSSGYLSPVQQRILCDTRRSLGNVFRSLSKVEMVGEDRTPLTLLPIRRRLGDTAGETAHRTTDAPGLLFYYLFENWENSYSLITRKESRYNLELQRVRQEMFACPKLAHIDRLDQIGRQLIVLKRHYQSYLRLIDRVIQPQQASMASLVNTRVASKASAESLSSPGLVAVPAHETMNAVASRVSQPREPTIVGDEGILPDMVTAAGTLLGVSLSSAARVRFERLRDSISLYALNETEDCLHQQESLVQMVCHSRLNACVWRVC